ncbi:Protein of unknown function [Filimonas lacunae]|uniref:DUF3667 domain-containing protein n=1 Tax=Filimonas lacunae TaxID=477680 RepID=A0A173MAW1_9BACT|nr:DUF3667 domain-containing protein [Filimonas lacunae]BAV04703.1 hypothetical protein FLA_0702 [Filimonas lacunae]SIT32339.1 Protein of unknown function [Filimonas lacunae]
MAHHKERTEKNCLNCNAQIHGRFCHVCGQENKHPKDSFGHLLTHFVSDIFHFDGKFFSTVKYLLIRPGFLSHEYMRGRRVAYLDPIRMYIFVSAFFFLIYFNFLVGHDKKAEGYVTGKTMTAKQVAHTLEEQQRKVEKRMKKPITAHYRTELEHKLERIHADSALLAKDTALKSEIILQEDDGFIFFDSNVDYSSWEAYNESQRLLPEKDRDGWLARYIVKKEIESQSKYGSGHAMKEQFSEKFLHSIPQIFFVSLPFFALILQLLYVRKKQFYYVDHIIYTLHLYSAIFVLVFFQTVISHLAEATWNWISYLNIFLSLYTLYYGYKSLRVFYEQKRSVTVIKYIGLLILGLWLIILLFLAFAALSLIRL